MKTFYSSVCELLYGCATSGTINTINLRVTQGTGMFYVLRVYET